jgi:NAD(P)H dehydrogenase (quinone)
MSIVITAATGQLGQLIISELLAAGVPAAGITAIARSKEKAADLTDKGVGLHIADYNQPDTFAGAFQPEDRVVLIPTGDVGVRTPQNAAVIEAARAAGVAQLAYTGAFGGPDADFALTEDHRATEQLILESGLPYTFLRNGWYSEVYLTHLAGAVERGVIANGVAPDSRIATAARADYAAAAAVVLSTDGHLNKAYELSGDTAWTFPQFADEVSRQSGKPVVHKHLSFEENKQGLIEVGLPEGFAEILADVDEAINRGRLAGTPGDLARLIGRPTTPIADSIAAALK